MLLEKRIQHKSKGYSFSNLSFSTFTTSISKSFLPYFIPLFFLLHILILVIVMSLWVDRNRPSSLAKLTLHAEITTRLHALAKSDELPHLLVYGPSGAGKKTRVMALLREIYGSGVEKIKLDHRSFKTTTNKTVEITTLGSNYHIECNPSDAGNSDRFVIQEVIKEIASHGTLQSGDKGARSFKIVILTEVDRLSR